jgi:thiamine pyrophosphate-dependent acetolactate synthase large subunit-like protein
MIMETVVRDNDIVVASTGFISREVFNCKDRPLNFYVMGSMGAALAIGIGIALHTKRKVIVINGDGSVLMSLGTLLTAQSLNLDNLHHYVIDNACHESTGGQPTVSNLINFQKLYSKTITYKVKQSKVQPPRITLKPIEIQERFRNALKTIGNK